ncbi:ISWI one complex protein 2 [Kluyveromyces marxianus]|uniref:ISWI one complex protein 2 n=1 Tax=Kluyveromyces marxianus TaxID=4911 RepID=A0ABX6EYG3_KLUMA|nr:ISWI one complex protein 2 [Kluyveromyces marxianus]
MNRSRRTRRSRSESEEQAAAGAEVEAASIEAEAIAPTGTDAPVGTDDAPAVSWDSFLERTTANQLNKLMPIPLDFVPFQDLIQSWYYQYSVMWLSNVCSGYWTQGFTSGKPWFTEITFDERLMLLDYQAGWSLHEEEAASAASAAEEEEGGEDEGGETGSTNLFRAILLRLLRSLEQDKTVRLEHWDEIVKYHIFNSKQRASLLWYTEDVNCKFSELNVVQQFEIIFHVIKLVERKNIGFRNYLQNHLDNFQFPEIWENDTTSLVVLPTGKIIRKQVSMSEPTSSSSKQGPSIPIKLQNCVVVEQTETTIDVIHLDYSDEIDAYLGDVKIEYETLAHDYRSFVEYLETLDDEDFQEFFQGLIEYHAEAEVYGRKLYANRLKQQSLQALMVRRKRSSRLVAREEEHQKKELETKWYDKLERREQFLRHRNRVLTRRTKKLKDYLWSLLWEKFEKDFTQEKLRRRNNNNNNGGAGAEPEPSQLQIEEIDAHVIEFGRNFKQWIVPIDEDAYAYKDDEIDTLELPVELCITQHDLDNLEKFGIPKKQYKVDSQNWYLDCKSGKHGINDFKKVKDHKIVCCEKTLRWELWEEQDPKVIEILSHGHDHLLTPRELGAVTMYDENLRRRSSRRDESASDKVSHVENRPTDRKPFDVTEPFLSARTLHQMEQELRNNFAAEVALIRTAEKRKAEEKEKRKRIKEEKKRQAQAKQNVIVQTASQTVPQVSTQTAPQVSAQTVPQTVPQNAPPTTSPQ